MNAISVAALIFCALATFTHIVTAAMVVWRYRRQSNGHPRRTVNEPVTLIRPVCGVDHYDELTLRSTFTIDYPHYNIIFCAARADDAAVPLVRALIAEYPAIDAKLLIGDDRPTANPKLNNIVKGWAAARSDWTAIADSNVLMRPDYLDHLLSAYTPDTGLVCSPPIGSHPVGLIAELECAFLNGYQARWQCAADAIGFGFAQGKSMLWRRDVLDAVGGIVALGSEIAEDAAATKIVRAQGLNVRLVDHPFEQPLGPRALAAVWNRQVRWARLRRATFAPFYVPEVLTGSALPIACGVMSAETLDVDSLQAFAILIAIWYGAEAIVTRSAGWHMSKLSPLAWALRDLLLPVLWVQGWTGNTFTWRGNAMTVADGKPIAARA
ncbi:MAG TPA: ceramide glucosyltransferase [Hyphomicrobium sp.]|nr:ceramide glucosyltransferase [Hyphomicrobium sp.]